MSNAEMTFGFVWSIIVIAIVAIPLLLLIAGLAKREVDKGEKGNTGIVGWVIAILIACAIFYALFFAGSDINHFRHT